jgi:hypothetical protein
MVWNAPQIIAHLEDFVNSTRHFERLPRRACRCKIRLGGKR